MSLLNRYKKLTFWNKFAFWAGLASITSLVFTVLPQNKNNTTTMINTKILTSNNVNNNTININTQEKIEFIKPFIIEKESNVKLLVFLSQKANEPNFNLQYFMYHPKYLNIGFLKSFDIYQKIKNKKILRNIIQLIQIIDNINIKIENLHNANNKMMYGNLQDIQSAIFDFTTVSKEAKEAIKLYNTIIQSYNKS